MVVHVHVHITDSNLGLARCIGLHENL